MGGVIRVSLCSPFESGLKIGHFDASVSQQAINRYVYRCEKGHLCA